MSTIVTDAMVEAALAAWYPDEWPDDVIFQSLEVGSENDETFGDRSRRDMRKTLEAALAVREATP